LKWPAKFLNQPKVGVLSSPDEVMSAIGQP
jgi:hypothetical protein